MNGRELGAPRQALKMCFVNWIKKPKLMTRKSKVQEQLHLLISDHCSISIASENFWFSLVFRRFRNGTMARKGSQLEKLMTRIPEALEHLKYPRHLKVQFYLKYKKLFKKQLPPELLLISQNKVTNTNFGSSLPEVFLGKSVLIICSKFRAEHPCTSEQVFSYEFTAYFQNSFS